MQYSPTYWLEKQRPIRDIKTNVLKPGWQNERWEFHGFLRCTGFFVTNVRIVEKFTLFNKTWNSKLKQKEEQKSPIFYASASAEL